MKNRLATRASILLFVAGCTTHAEPPEDTSFTYGAARVIGRIEDQELSESSGLVASRRMPGLFWTHNDSGDSPRLFLISNKGKTIATFRVTNAKAVDWEDIGYVERDGKHYLLIADVGDNARRRAEVQLYLVEEPSVNIDRETASSGKVAVSETIRVRYEDGAQDCESVAFDPVTRDVLLVTKHLTKMTAMYKVAIDDNSDGNILTANRVGELQISLPTAMDVSQDGHRLIVVNYLNGFEYERLGEEPWSQVIGKDPLAVKLPVRRQGEAVCYGFNSESLFLTSEGKKSPFWKVPAIRSSAGK
jgi:hypothetical protein